MRIGQTTAAVLPTLLLASLATVAQAAVGMVINEKHEPIEGVRVCYFIDKIELYCNLTDENGRYELPQSQVDTIRAIAEGYNPRIVSSAAQQGPIMLKRAPALRVRLIDGASGEQIPAAEVLISYPSGKELGPFPANKAGLQIRRGLLAGEIRLSVKADGFRDSEPVSVTLEAGEETAVTIELVAVKPRETE